MRHWWPSWPIKKRASSIRLKYTRSRTWDFSSFERTFSFWKDVSMGIDGKLVNGKQSLCVCKQIATKFYICAAIIIALFFFTIYRIIFCFRIVYRPLKFFEKLVFKKVKVRDSVRDSVFVSRSVIWYIIYGPYDTVSDRLRSVAESLFLMNCRGMPRGELLPAFLKFCPGLKVYWSKMANKIKTEFLESLWRCIDK